MNFSENKVTDLKTAVRRYVKDGSHISIGGFTISRNPMAAVYEIIRQRIRGLHLYAHSNGQGVDELIGAGCVSRLEIAYGGNGRFASTCIRFRHAVEKGEILVEDYSNYQMTLRFQAGAMGLPFLPTRSGLGTDLINKWGFSPQFRLKESSIPEQKLAVIENPFGNWTDTSSVVLVPAINPDVTLIHVQKADTQGTVRIAGLTFADIEQAKAARHVIVTCEELVDTVELRSDPDRNQLPFFCVSAVVHVPYGAYPTACYRYYDYDPVYLKDYANYAENDKRFNGYLEKYIRKIKNHDELLSFIGNKRLMSIKANSETGYAAGLDRR